MLRKGDFVKIDYDAWIASNNKLFDTTSKSTAEKNGLEGELGPQTIILGARHVIAGLDEEIQKHETGQEFEAVIPPDKAFGSRNPELIKLIPINEFRKRNMRPIPGLTLDFQGLQGIITSASGGRVRVDFNHPLAGRSVKYKVRILSQITDKKEQVQAILNIRLKPKNAEIQITEECAKIKLDKPYPEYYTKTVSDEIEKYVGVKAEFEPENKKETSKEAKTQKKVAKETKN